MTVHPHPISTPPVLMEQQLLPGIDWGVLLDSSRTNIANELHMDIDYLKKKWQGGFMVKNHWFSTSPTFSCIWALEPSWWETLGKAYCDWFCMPEEWRTVQFWDVTFRLLQYDPEFYSDENTGFREWMVKEKISPIIHGENVLLTRMVS